MKDGNDQNRTSVRFEREGRGPAPVDMGMVATDADRRRIIEEMLARFAVAESAESKTRQLALEDQRFENGEQWTRAELAERAGRPSIVINKTQAFVKLILGEAKRNRFSIKYIPVDDRSDPGTARIMTGLARNIEQVSNAKRAYDKAFQDAVISSFGYFRVLTDYVAPDSFDQDIIVERVQNPFTVYMDPNTRKADRSDAKWAVIIDDMPRDDFEAMYPGKDADGLGAGGVGDAGAAGGSAWITQDYVRVAEYYWFEDRRKTLALIVPPSDSAVMMLGGELEDLLPMVGKTVYLEDVSDETVQRLRDAGMIGKERVADVPQLYWCKCTASDVLEGPKALPGKYIPVIMVVGEEVFIEGERVLRSAVRHSKDAQKLYNWARSNAVEQLALAPRQPWIVTKEMIEGYEEQWETAYKAPRPYLLVNDTGSGNRPDRLAPSLPNAGDNTEAMIAADDIKATSGIFDASLGARGNEVSGRAINARKMQANIANIHFSDNLQMAIEHFARILLDLIPKIYDTERVVRILNEDGSAEWVKINARDPNDPSKRIYDLSVGRYDVVVTSGPAYSTQRQEALDAMTMFAQASPEMGALIGDLIAKNQDWPGADEFAERMRKLIRKMHPDVIEPTQEEIEKGQAVTPEMLEVQKLQAVVQELQAELKAAQDRNAVEMQKLAIQADMKREELERQAVLKAQEAEMKQQEAELKKYELMLKEKEILLKRAEIESRERVEGAKIAADLRGKSMDIEASSSDRSEGVEKGEGEGEGGREPAESVDLSPVMDELERIQQEITTIREKVGVKVGKIVRDKDGNMTGVIVEEA